MSSIPSIFVVALSNGSLLVTVGGVFTTKENAFEWIKVNKISNNDEHGKNTVKYNFRWVVYERKLDQNLTDKDFLLPGTLTPYYSLEITP